MNCHTTCVIYTIIFIIFFWYIHIKHWALNGTTKHSGFFCNHDIDAKYLPVSSMPITFFLSTKLKLDIFLKEFKLSFTRTNVMLVQNTQTLKQGILKFLWHQLYVHNNEQCGGYSRKQKKNPMISWIRKSCTHLITG